MGDPSSLRLVPASVASIPIDWTRVPEESKKKLREGWGYDWEKKVERPLPTTIEDLAIMFDESKFFGYFKSSVCTLLMDISEFGLQPSPGRVGPRFYMKYLQEVWFLLFAPGTRDCIAGYSHKIPWKECEDENEDEDEFDKKIAAEETEIAQKFDVILERDVLAGKARFVPGILKLGGWAASMVQDDLQVAQLSEAMFTLPRSHPARQEFFSSMLSSFWK